jgi:hypothetical protein
MSSTELIDDDDYSTIHGLPAYQQSLQNFLKRQLSNTTQSALEADKDIEEIDLDEERESMFDTIHSNNMNSESYQSPVYPALFLNNNNNNENDNIFVLDDENFYYHGNTSVYENETNEDYFTLYSNDGQGMTLSGIVTIEKKYLYKITNLLLYRV